MVQLGISVSGRVSGWVGGWVAGWAGEIDGCCRHHLGPWLQAPGGSCAATASDELPLPLPSSRCPHAWRTAPVLPALRLGPLQVGGAELVSAKYEADPAGASGLLEAIPAARVPSLQQLLAALVPPGKPLTTLSIQNGIRQRSGLEVPALQGCGALAGLHSLLLSRIASGDAALEALLQQAPRLKELVLDSYFAGSLPPSLTAKQGLETLQIVGGYALRGLQLLPGPYVLSSTQGGIVHVPLAHLHAAHPCSAAPVLTWLARSCCAHASAGLRNLVLHQSFLPGTLVSGLSADCLAPGLPAATALRRLQLGGDACVALTM